MPKKDSFLEDNPLWYKDAIIYELHVKGFFDSNGDGIGDFQGVTKKLDYLENLGITAVWLLPFYPSPLKDDGYDIADYFNVNPDYGSLRDFREFLRQAHKRGIRVITELVLNHTSDQHAWFKRARRSKPGSAWRDFYVWSDTAEKYQDARIIFKDYETSNWTLDPLTKQYYWHRFYSHQPDLNFDNIHMRKALFKVIDFWFEMGVDGLRLDAVPYLYEREGTNCENLPETYAFLKELRAYVDRKYKDRMLLAEANQWPEDAVYYFGDGDACHMAFHFPLMPRIYMAFQMEDPFPIIDILDQTPDIPDNSQWALFLRNHDELTLEMVTDEERDFMYRVYARDPRARINLGIRRRLAPLINNHRRKIELMNILLFSLPGTPIIYFGDEIGMGDNYYLGDRNGVRTPMQWSPDRNAGFSKANPHKLYLPVIIDPEYHYEAVNVENSESNPSSLLWWMKRLIALRKRYKAFSRGRLEFLSVDNPKVLALTRDYEDQTVLVVVNLSRYHQAAEIDLSRYSGYYPEEINSQNRFPVIKESPYVLTMGFYDYFWFLLRKESDSSETQAESALPEFAVKGNWKNALEGRALEKLAQDILPGYLKACRWFGGKARTIRKIRVVDRVPLDAGQLYLLVLKVSYIDGEPDHYVLPVSFSSTDGGSDILNTFPQAAISRLRIGEEAGILYDGSFNTGFQEMLLNMIAKGRTIRGQTGSMIAYRGREFRGLMSGRTLPISSHVLSAEQSNTSIVYENTFFLKMYRRIEEGLNPDLEISRMLTEKAGFEYMPPFAGAIELKNRGSGPVALCTLQGLVPNQGDAWTFSLEALERYFEQVLTKKEESSKVRQEELPKNGEEMTGQPCLGSVCMLPHSIPALEFSTIPDLFKELVGVFYLEMVNLLGKRTGEMHMKLASLTDDADFAPEPFSLLYQKSVYQSMRSLLRRVFQSLKKNLKKLPEDTQAEAFQVLGLEQNILENFQMILERKISAVKIRTHGDYHLGQVLFTGKDFLIIDFEGEPARPLTERRLKRSPFRDVAGMIRSFHYAVYNAYLHHTALRPEDGALLEPWLEPWYSYVSGIFLRSYRETVGTALFVPQEIAEIEILLKCFILEKAVYELGYELNNRPDWLTIPFKGILNILTMKAEGSGV